MLLSSLPLRWIGLGFLMSSLLACTPFAEQPDVSADDDDIGDDDDFADDDDDIAIDDDDIAHDDDDIVGDDDDIAHDDDDFVHDDDDSPPCFQVSGFIHRDAGLPPIDAALKLEVMALAPEFVGPGGMPTSGNFAAIDVRYDPGPLLDEEDRYGWSLCVPMDEHAIVVFLDVTFDDDAITPGDYHGFAPIDVTPSGGSADVVLDHVLSPEDCQH